MQVILGNLILELGPIAKLVSGLTLVTFESCPNLLLLSGNVQRISSPYPRFAAARAHSFTRRARPNLIA